MRTVWLKWRAVAAAALLLLAVYLLYLLYTGGVWDTCNLLYQADKKVQHVKVYCNFPDHGTAHGDEGEVSTAKDGTSLKLVSVHAVIRHGDRDNLHSLPNYKNPSLTCRITEELKMTIPVLEDYEKVMKKNRDSGGRGPSQTFHEWDLFPDKEKCSPGLLTPEGAAQHILNGKLFHQKYLVKHHLLSEEKFEKEVLLRSTDYPRTFQSALALLYGFLPNLKVSDLQIEMAKNNTMCTEDTGHSCVCSVVEPYLDVMSATFEQTSKAVRESSLGVSLNQHVAQVLGVDVSEVPRPSHIMDVSMVHMCHSLLLPGTHGQCLQPRALAEVYDLLAQNGARQVKLPTFQRIARLKFQPLLHEIAQRMVKQTNQQTPIKFALYAGHDTTIEPLATALNFSKGIWSRYASRIVFELYAPEGAQNTADHYIRVLYDGEVVTGSIPFCQHVLVDKLLGLCPVDKFIKFVRIDNLKGLGETDYAQACSKPVGAGA